MAMDLPPPQIIQPSSQDTTKAESKNLKKLIYDTRNDISKKTFNIILPEQQEKLYRWKITGEIDSLKQFVEDNYDGKGNFKIVGFENIDGKTYVIKTQIGGVNKKDTRNPKNDYTTIYADDFKGFSDQAMKEAIAFSDKTQYGINVTADDFKIVKDKFGNRIDMQYVGKNIAEMRKVGKIRKPLTHITPNGEKIKVTNGWAFRPSIARKSGDIVKTDIYDELERLGYDDKAAEAAVREKFGEGKEIREGVNTIIEAGNKLAKNEYNRGNKTGYNSGKKDGFHNGIVAEKANTRLVAGANGVYNLEQKMPAYGGFVNWTHSSGFGLEASYALSLEDKMSGSQNAESEVYPNGMQGYTNFDSTSAKSFEVAQATLITRFAKNWSLRLGAAYQKIKDMTKGESETGILRTTDGVVLDKDITNYEKDNSKEFFQPKIGIGFDYKGLGISLDYLVKSSDKADHSISLNLGYNFNSNRRGRR